MSTEGLRSSLPFELLLEGTGGSLCVCGNASIDRPTSDIEAERRPLASRPGPDHAGSSPITLTLPPLSGDVELDDVRVWPAIAAPAGDCGGEPTSPTLAAVRTDIAEPAELGRKRRSLASKIAALIHGACACCPVRPSETFHCQYRIASSLASSSVFVSAADPSPTAPRSTAAEVATVADAEDGTLEALSGEGARETSGAAAFTITAPRCGVPLS